MSAHASHAFSTAHCTDSEDLPSFTLKSVTHSDIQYFDLNLLANIVVMGADKCWITCIKHCTCVLSAGVLLPLCLDSCRFNLLNHHFRLLFLARITSDGNISPPPPSPLYICNSDCICTKCAEMAHVDTSHIRTMTVVTKKSAVASKCSIVLHEALTQLIGSVTCHWVSSFSLAKSGRGKSFVRIGTVLYAEGLWLMRRHGPVIAHCTDLKDFPRPFFFDDRLGLAILASILFHWPEWPKVGQPFFATFLYGFYTKIFTDWSPHVCSCCSS